MGCAVGRLVIPRSARAAPRAMTAPPELEAALWAARMLWAVGTSACLLASDLPCISVGPLRRIAHYGKLRADAPALSLIHI